MPKIFISYRRSDSEERAHRIADWLVLKYGSENIFVDIDTIRSGEDFPQRLRLSLEETDVVLVIIGPTWVEELSRRSVAGEEDFVAIEVATSLDHQKYVVPVLLDDTPVPDENLLPDNIKPLLVRNTATVRLSDFHYDLERLREDIDRHFPSRRRWIAGVALAALVVIVAVLIALNALGEDEPDTASSPSAFDLAERGVTNNAEWEPFVEESDGVEMALVPAGCFMMGSEDGDSDEQPAHEICFEEPFSIDRYEVTNDQYGGPSTDDDCLEASSDPNQPRICVNWFEAHDFCEERGTRLPTEAEWEYAARGPDALVYPWGNGFIADNVVYSGNAGGTTAAVGSRTGGVSWVDVYDLSGNVWEWTSTIYDRTAFPYPYRADDGREIIDNDSFRVLRGGSWTDFDNQVRATFRRGESPFIDVFYDFGFRCARSY